MAKVASDRSSSAGPIRIWAALGALFLAVQLYAYGRWMASDDFRATALGADPVPTVPRIASITYEILSIATLAVALVWFVRGIRRTGRIDSTRLLMLGWLSAYWLDPWLNFLRPMFTYNAYHFNRGCWCEYIPFWQSPGGARIAEPLLIDPPSYFVTFTATALFALAAMRRAKGRWPKLSVAGLVLAGFVAVWATMGLLDIAATRLLGFDAWPIAFQRASFWGGRAYQFPIYEFVLFPSTFVACALLLYFADDNGTTIIERGVGAVRGERLQTTARILAFVAFCNLLNLGYTSAMGMHAQFADPWPRDLPSWLANEQCGGMTNRPCPVVRP
ncbi:MAG: spirocyclase AveC family protein [Sphingomicrobium sp.]